MGMIHGGNDGDQRETNDGADMGGGGRNKQCFCRVGLVQSILPPRTYH